MPRSRLPLLLSCAAWLVLATSAYAEPSAPAARPRKIYAHYMGCFVVGVKAMATDGLHKTEADLKPDGPTYLDRIGGRMRDLPLTPAHYRPTLDEAVDLEMRRAMRIGIDGFAIDVLAGQQDAIEAMDAMFRVAEAKHYPFEITFCLDNPDINPRAVRHLVELHRHSPNLARRDGKILVLGYRSYRLGLRARPDLPAAAWLQPEGFQAYDAGLKELEQIAGEPIYAQFDLNGAVPDVQDGVPAPPADSAAFWRTAAREMSGRYGAWSGFFWGGPSYDLAAQAARQAGLEWGEPMWCQYQNLYWNTFRLRDGSDLLRERWAHAEQNHSTLIQVATWNDYSEATQIAPAQQTGYAFYDLMGMMIHRWKTGAFPEPERDRVYVFYPAYPAGSPVFPFHDFAPEITSQLEVLTILAHPARVILPGRNESWDASAGLSVRKFPPTAGPVTVQVQRAGAVVLALTAREPITDRPFRAQHSSMGFSSEDARLWHADFPQTQEQPQAYYADDDHDGLPNWYEMLYAGRLGDFSTATAAAPEAMTPSGLTNLAAYRAQRDPRRAAAADHVVAWDLLTNPINRGYALGCSSNPEPDADGNRVWRYVSERDGTGWQLLADAALAYPADVETFIYSRETRNALARGHGPAGRPAQITYEWTRQGGAGDSAAWTRSVRLEPTTHEKVGVEWIAPREGQYRVEWRCRAAGAASAAVSLRWVQLRGAVSKVATAVTGERQEQTFTAKRGEGFRLEVAAGPGAAAPSLELVECRVAREP